VVGEAGLEAEGADESGDFLLAVVAPEEARGEDGE
jgi:hypothetical protein